MPSSFQPAPTYADVILVDEATRKSKFNPIWLNWFLELASGLGPTGAGSVTSVSVASANGFAGTVATSTTTPVVTLTTSITAALLAGNGTALSAASLSSGHLYVGNGSNLPVDTAPAALTKTDDTNVTVTLGGSPTTALVNAASVTLGWTGQLSYARGGTGASSFTQHGAVTAGATALNTVAPGLAGHLLTSDGTDWVSAAPATSGTVTSVAETFTGGLIAVSGSPITTSGTLALTVAGTSGGIPYFSGTTTWASTGALTASALLLGGGAGAGPAALGSLGTTATVLHGNAAGNPSWGSVVATDLTPGTQYQVLQTNSGATAAEWIQWPVDDQTVDAGETMIIPAGFSKTIAGPLVVSGTLSISGRLLII